MPQAPATDEALVESFIEASQALVDITTRSLSALSEELTLRQYRALLVLADHGPQRAAELAAALGVTPGTGSRMIERLIRKQLVLRSRSREDRRATFVHLTNAGRQLVERAGDRRRREIARILGALPQESRTALAEGMEAFTEAAALSGG